jgi:hypothetical protein
MSRVAQNWNGAFITPTAGRVREQREKGCIWMDREGQREREGELYYCMDHMEQVLPA